MYDEIEDAQYRVVHEFRRGRLQGAVGLATLTGLNAGTLSNKVNPSCEGHNLTIKEAVAIQLTAGDHRILQAEAQALNHVAVPLGDFSGVSDAELLDTYARYHADLGETAKAISDALADGAISQAEVRRIRREGFEDFRRFFEFLSRLEAIAEDG